MNISIYVRMTRRFPAKLALLVRFCVLYRFRCIATTKNVNSLQVNFISMKRCLFEIIHRPAAHLVLMRECYEMHFLYLKQICALCLANKGEFVMVSFRLTLRCTTTYDSSMSRLLLGVPLV